MAKNMHERSRFCKNNVCAVLDEEMDVDDDSYVMVNPYHSTTADDTGSSVKTPQGIDVEIVKGSIARQQVRYKSRDEHWGASVPKNCRLRAFQTTCPAIFS
jgi:hypothetical protein